MKTLTELTIGTCFLLLLVLEIPVAHSQNKNPEKIKLITSDLDNFWEAYDKSLPDYKSNVFDQYYIKKGSPGLKGFMKGRIGNAENLSASINMRPQYYASLREICSKVSTFERPIKSYLVKMKEFYPDAIFPPVYFVIGVMNSGGTISRNGLIIGVDMYGLASTMPVGELSTWHKEVLKSINEIPHIVAHELVHFQQKYDGNDLLSACIKEGAADFIAELISGSHINNHVHEFANPKERELWLEFKEKMFMKDFSGWLYSSQEGRPNDLGYWMGYQITKAYFEKKSNKIEAVRDIMTIKDFKGFLDESGYAEKF